MKKTIRAAALLSAAVLFLSGLSGCEEGKSSEGSGLGNAAGQSAQTTGEVPELAKIYPEFQKPHSAKITFFEMGWTGPEKDLDIVAPEIKRLTNFEIVYEPMTVPTGDDYNQKLNLLIAGGEVPQVFFGGQDEYTRTVYQKLGDSGEIWDVKELIKDYPNLYELIKPELQLFEQDGKNYQIPSQTGRGNEVLYDSPAGINIRVDFLKKLNMEYPKNMEEFYTYLKRCKEEIKDVNGQPIVSLTLGENLSGLEFLYEPFLPVVGNSSARDLPFDPANDFEVKNYLFTDSPELMEICKYLNRLSREGLMDREVLTLKTAQFGERISSGNVAAAPMSWWDMNTYSDNAKANVPDLMYALTPPIYQTPEIQKNREAKWTNWIGSWSSLIISKEMDEETLRHLLATLDWLTTKDGQLLTQAGVEGVSYTFNEEGKYEHTADFLNKTNNLDWNKAAAYGVGYYCQMAFNMPVFTDLREKPASILREDNYQGWLNRQRERDLYDPKMEPPKSYYFLPGPVESQKFTPILDARREFFARIISATSEAEVESEVQKWAQICISMGIDEIIAERQSFIDQFPLDS